VEEEHKLQIQKVNWTKIGMSSSGGGGGGGDGCGL
jgi:hypothetical protein